MPARKGPAYVQECRAGLYGPPSAGRAGGGGGFGFARAVQDVHDSVIAFVAGVLVERSFDARHLVLAAPWAVPGRLVFHGELITDLVGRRQREALDDLEVLGGAAERRAVGDVRRLDDHR